MAQQQTRTGQLARAVHRRLPKPLRRALGRVRRSLRGHTPAVADVEPLPSHPPTAPALSIVIPVYNVEPYLAECLESVRRQSFAAFEVLLVDDGSTDGSRDIMDRFARRDARFVVLEQPNQGQATARNLAVRRARGEFLMFVDGDDVVPKGAVSAMVRSLRASGSDLVVGAAMRLRNGRLSAPIWNSTVHQRDRRGLTIDDFPGALWDVIACNRMFRRTFWIEKVGGFRSGQAYEDHVPMVAAYVRAASFDLLARTVYHWRYRENLSSESQQKHRLDNLRDRIAVKAEAADLVTREASAAVQAAWLGRVLDTDLASYIDFALIADDHYRATLREAFQHYWHLSDSLALAHVRVLQKIRGFLVCEARWEDLIVVQSWFRDIGGMPATEVIDGRVHIRALAGPLTRLDLPDAVTELAWHETALRACLARAVWIDDETLEVSGWAFPANVDLSTTTLQLSLRMIGRRTGQLINLDAKRDASPDPTRWSGQRRAAVDSSAFTTRVSADLFSGLKPDCWQLEVSVSAQGVARSGPIFEAVSGSSASPGLLRPGRPSGSPTSLVPRFDPALGFVVDVRRLTAELESGSALGGTLSGRVGALGNARLPTTLVLVQQTTKQRVTFDLVPETAHQGRFTLDLGELGATAEQAPWELRHFAGKSAASAISWPRTGFGQDPSDPEADQAHPHWRWQPSPTGAVQLTTAPAPVVALDAEIGAEELVVVLDRADLTADELLGVELVSSSVTVPLRAVDRTGDGLLRWRFLLAVSRFGLAARPLPAGSYQVAYRDALGAKRLVRAHPTLRSRLIQEQRGAHHRMRLSATATALKIQLAAPLADNELGRYAETALLDQYTAMEPLAESAVLFQSWDGGVAAGDQLALHRALGTMRPGLTRYWAVADHSVVAPTGARPVVIGSREYWEVLARARFLCSNVDLGRRLVKRPYQRFLQTFDGHPFSAAGRGYWSGRRGYPETWIAAECARLNDQWDALVAPNRTAAEIYRAEYDFSGEILTVGSPRCDQLVTGVSGTRRAAIRRALGADEHQIITLYAPTARDLLTTRGSTKRRFDELDLQKLSGQLGPRHHIWVRGHHDNKRVPDRVSGIERTRDVTDYPDVNDLMLAADVLLTDYSAIRFDWAVTGKPMVFFVADERSYFALRPALLEFADSAPGPVARTTAEVIELISRPQDLVRRWGSALTTFNRRFNRFQDGSASQRVVDAFFN